MQLVIVESPAKAKTIEKYLGKDYKVLASYGHVRDLPPKDGSVRPDEDFAMDWEVYGDKARQVKAITDAAKVADRTSRLTLTAKVRRSAGTFANCWPRKRRCPRMCSGSPSTPSPRMS